MTNIEKTTFLAGLERALTKVTNPRFFETERGYQGALIAALQEELASFNWEKAIIEQEYQKRIREHGIRVRPDIIIHVPFANDEHNTRGEGNFVVFELKLNANESSALVDYANLSAMCSLLNYPLAVFININSNQTHIDKYEGENKHKLVSYSVNLSEDQAVISKSVATA
ncbi:hypothetical protein GNP61_14435 [Aliivibrio fischeri]|uniref:hypothetical protein n=1 Tax=Aliivibrio fischeri TaxID=668 RepID=UPI0012DA0F39|nr:hypothetical protein [Aliivibrio fischeri]MUK42752.1 hypothetical protein [Aliivibrio fischeri]